MTHLLNLDNNKLTAARSLKIAMSMALGLTIFVSPAYCQVNLTHTSAPAPISITPSAPASVAVDGNTVADVVAPATPGGSVGETLTETSSLQAQTPVEANTPDPTVLEGHVTRPGVSAAAPPPAERVKSKLFGITDELKVEAPPPKNTNPIHKAGNVTKSLANFALDLRGFDWSKEGATAALDEKVEAKSDSAKEYVKRIDLDQREMNVVRAIFNIADGLGTPDGTQKIAEQLKTIETEVGETQSIDAYNRIMALRKSDTVVPQESWSLADQEAKTKAIVEAAAEADPIVKDLKARLHKYNNRSKAIQISAKAIYSACNIAGMLPTLAAPIAGISQMTFMMATGGPEQDKLLKEVYLAKCLESRYRNLIEKTHLITSCQARAAMTKNPALLECSKILLKDMTSDAVVASIFSTTNSSVATASADTRDAAPRQIAEPAVANPQ